MKLQEWCKKNGWSIAGVARHTKIPKSYLYQILQGHSSMSDTNIDKIIALTDGACTYEELKRKVKRKAPKK